MTSRQVLIPDATHPITISPLASRVVVSVGGTVIAQTSSALSLQEANYPAVAYVPLVDVEPSVLRDSHHTTYCPYKGDATYLSVVVDDTRTEDGIWRYENPSDSVREIAGYVAFYPDRFQIQILD
jgi:uncharacterized protein (DUF427 family)